MNKYRILLTVLFCAGLMAAASLATFGQPEANPRVEPSYEVSLQLLIGSNGGAKADFPQNLSGISSHLKSAFAFNNYRVAGTYLGRISNTGNFEYKSVDNISGRELGLNPQTFLEWSVVSLKSGTTAKGGAGFQAQNFKFGARVPVTTATVKDEAGKERPLVNYENIGLNLSKLGMQEGLPTLVGTINMPGASDTIFLVMTVKSVDL
ncbi:hypothetical protein BH10ACI2_BH10ACI2_26240 [soil metagenome]